MASFNRVILLGNLTRDPVTKVLPTSQTTITEFGLAVNRKYRTGAGEDREEVTFVDCTAFGKQAELIKQYLAKGKPLFIEGRLKLDTWEDRNGGGKRSKITVVVENFQFVGGRDGGGGGGGGGYGGQGGESYGGGGGYDDPGYDAPPPREQRPMNRSSAPQQNRGPAGGGQSRQSAPPPQHAEPPFGDEQQFKDDDIPF